MKPSYSEIEIEELCDLNLDTGYSFAVGDVMSFLKTLGYSDVNAVVIAIRKEFPNKIIRERHEKRKARYPNSTLSDTLYKRINYEEVNKTK